MQFVAVVVVIVVFAVAVEAVNSVKFSAYNLLLHWTSHTNSTHKQLVQMDKSKLLFVPASAKICSSVTSETLKSLYASLEQRREQQAGLSKLADWMTDWQAGRQREGAVIAITSTHFAILALPSAEAARSFCESHAALPIAI